MPELSQTITIPSRSLRQREVALRAIIRSAMEQLFEFCARLERLGVRYDMQIARPDAVMVTLVLPGEYLEIEFFADGSLEVERFCSQGVDSASDADLDVVIAALSS